MEYLYLLLCLGAIVVSADWLVAGAVTIAKRFRISDFVIGAVIVGIGTSFPELVVSSIGAFEGSSDIAIGNVVGSNIFNVLGILGLTAVIMPVAVSRENMRFDLPFCIGVSVVAILLAFNFFMGGDAVIGRADGLVLLAIFTLFIYLSLRSSKGGNVASDEVITNRALAMGVGKVALGLGGLIVASNFFLDNAIAIAQPTLYGCGSSPGSLTGAKGRQRTGITLAQGLETLPASWAHTGSSDSGWQGVKK